LSGIFVKDKQAVALFTKKSEAKKYARLKVGQLLAGVLISEIQADRVILKIAGQTKVVLLRKPRADAPSQPKSVARLGQPQIPPVPQPGRPGKPMTPPSNINPENANDDSQKN
jgi:type II secretory pathway component PulC